MSLTQLLNFMASRGMKTKGSFILGFGMVAGCAIYSPPSLEAICARKAPNWKAAYRKDLGEGKGTISEFVPDGENVNDWRQLATIQFLEGEKRSPKAFMETLKAKMESRCKSTKWNVVKQEKYSITYEWSIESCTGHHDQYEIARLLQGNDGLHRIAYTEKNKDMAEDTRKLWLEVVEDAYVAKGSCDNRI